MDWPILLMADMPGRTQAPLYLQPAEYELTITR